ncbi:MAG: hypothetical protein DRK00_08840 [Thermoprotei archaeon]|nr:MAG: hypothetical protein DRK00_08840 [Thermoprotei archaeon]
MSRKIDPILRKYLNSFKSYMRSEECKRALKERKEKTRLIRELLSRENLERLDEYGFGELIKCLWAIRSWTNKDYVVQRILEDNDGIENIKRNLKDLLYGAGPFPQRFDRFLNNVKGIGPAMITEILCFFNPSDYGIWNRRARESLKILGMSTRLPFINKYYIRGVEYQKFNELLKEIALTLRSRKPQGANLLETDFFLYYVWKTARDLEPTETLEDFDHNEIRDMVRDIGLFLGFNSETEAKVARGARVDVVWRARIANLGEVAYVFEVHREGSIESLILNLQKALRNPEVQKAVIVSTPIRIEKIRREMEGLSPDFSESVTFWHVNEVVKAYEHLSEAMEIIGKLQLVKQTT